MDLADSDPLRELRPEGAARAAGTHELLYCWHDDDREADMRVYFVLDEDLEIVACQLDQIDDRTPTRQERLRYETDFDAEMQAGGDLWLAVASRIWDRSAT